VVAPVQVPAAAAMQGSAWQRPARQTWPAGQRAGQTSGMPVPPSLAPAPPAPPSNAPSPVALPVPVARLPPIPLAAAD
jgi:hypothetical protein